MGSTTEFHIILKLKRDTPAVVIDFLKRITAPEPADHAYTEEDWNEHFKVPDIDNPFFKCERWDSMFCNSAFCGFPAIFKTNTAGGHHLELHSELKNYDQEIQKLVDWLTPYVKGHKKKCCVGWWRHEDQDDYSRHYMYIDFPYHTSPALAYYSKTSVDNNFKNFAEVVSKVIKPGGKIIVFSTPADVNDNVDMKAFWENGNGPKRIDGLPYLWASLECYQPGELTRQRMLNLYYKIKKDR